MSCLFYSKPGVHECAGGRARRKYDTRAEVDA